MTPRRRSDDAVQFLRDMSKLWLLLGAWVLDLMEKFRLCECVMRVIVTLWTHFAKGRK